MEAAKKKVPILSSTVTFALVTGIVGTIIFEIFLHPLTEWARRGMFGYMGTVGTNLLNSIYASAVRGPEGEILKTLFFWISWGVVSVIYFIHSKGLDIRSEILAASKDLSRLEGKVRGEVPQEDEQDPLGRIEGLKKTSGKLLSNITWLTRVSLVFLVVATVSLSWNALKVGAALGVRSEYSLRLDALSPALLPAERASLVAEWSRVSTEKQYDALSKRMVEIARARRQPLPNLE